ncbi:MAG: YceI family protein [Alphaproteobacteria bacterium]
MMRALLTASALLALTAAAGAADEKTIRPVATDVPAGTYLLDRAHTSLIFRVNHIGFSWFTARFTHVEGELDLEPSDPAASQLRVFIDPLSIETDYPEPETYDFNADLAGPSWLDSARFPEITFRSTAIELLDPDTARITGDLSLHGVTQPVTMEATFNGGYASHPLDPFGARIGFSARGTLERSDFGIALGIPEPGTTMGVGDTVEFIIETEFTLPVDGLDDAGGETTASPAE